MSTSVDERQWVQTEREEIPFKCKKSLIHSRVDRTAGQVVHRGCGVSILGDAPAMVLGDQP